MRLMFSKAAVAALLITALAACAGSPNPGPTLYLLSAPGSNPPGPGLEQAGANLALDRVEVSGFLDTSGIVYQTGPNAINVAAGNLWAEPLPAQLHRQIFATLSRQLRGISVYPNSTQAPAQSLRLGLEFSAFHGRHDGQALVAGTWSLTDAGNESLLRQPFEYQVPLQSDGYDELVRALDAGLQQTIGDIAVSLNQFAASGSTQ